MSAQGLPPNLLALFAPRPPLKHLPPCKNRFKKPEYMGVADFVPRFETDAPPPKETFETPDEKKMRKKQQKIDAHRRKQAAIIAEYDPNSQPCATKNPFATLFVARLSYETNEKKLKKEFERYGPVRKVKIITDLVGKSRGYAFVEYESESDLKTAYKQADATKIDGRRVLVDVERARTVSHWLPRRLGGGKGPARFAEPKKKRRTSLPSPRPSSTSYVPRQSSSTRDPPRSSGYSGRSSYSGRDNNSTRSSRRPDDHKHSSYGGGDKKGGERSRRSSRERRSSYDRDRRDAPRL